MRTLLLFLTTDTVLSVVRSSLTMIFYRTLLLNFAICAGISKFRVQSDGSSLPNARQLTLTLFKNVSKVCDHKNNELLVPWAQLVAHDIAFSPVNSVNSTFPGKNVVSDG